MMKRRTLLVLMPLLLTCLGLHCVRADVGVHPEASEYFTYSGLDPLMEWPTTGPSGVDSEALTARISMISAQAAASGGRSGVFASGEPLELEVHCNENGTIPSSVLWSLPSTCSFLDGFAASDALIQVSCGASPLRSPPSQNPSVAHAIGISLDGAHEEVFYLTTTTRFGCYDWVVSAMSGHNPWGWNEADIDDSLPHWLEIESGESIELALWLSAPAWDVVSAATRVNTAGPSTGTTEAFITASLRQQGSAPIAQLLPDASGGDAVESMKEYALTWNPAWGAWDLNFTAPETVGSYTLVIQDPVPVTVLGCRSRSQAISVAVIVGSPPSSDLDLPLTSPSAAPSGVARTPAVWSQHPCSRSNVVVLVSEPAAREFVWSESLGLTSVVVHVPSGSLVGAGLESMTPSGWHSTGTTWIALGDNGALEHVDAREGAAGRWTALGTPNGLPDPGVTPMSAVRYSDSCELLQDSTGQLLRETTSVVTWSSGEVAMIWASFDGGLVWNEVHLPATVDGTALSSVIDATLVVSDPLGVVVLVNLTGAGDVALISAELNEFDNEGLSWNTGVIWGSGRAAGVLAADTGTLGPRSLVSSAQATLEVWIAGDDVWYSPDGGRSAVRVRLWSRDASRPVNSRVTLVTSSGVGEVLIGTEDGRLWYGRAGMMWGIEITSPLPPASGTPFERTVLFDAAGRAAMIGVDFAGAPPETLRPWKMIALGSELVSPAAPESEQAQWSCPFTVVDVSIPSVGYLDVGDVLEGSVALSGTSSGVLDVRMVSTLTQVVKHELTVQTMPLHVGHEADYDYHWNPMTHALSASPAALMYRRESSLKLTAKWDLQEDEELIFSDELVEASTVRGTVQLAPQSQSLGCQPASSLSSVRVGCPPGRHVRVLHPSLSVSTLEWEGAPVLTPVEAVEVACADFAAGGSLSSWELRSGQVEGADDGTEYEYDIETLGCPLWVYHADGVRPVLQLWDGDEYVRDVDGSFALWEENSRVEWGFNATAADAGCLRAPLSLEALLEDGGDGATPSSVWTKESYRSCFRSPGDGDVVASGDETYPFVNSTGVSAVSFSGRGGMFVFTARVIDPEYSFCDLEVSFGVWVYGAPLSVVQVVAIVSIALLIILGGLAGSYYWMKSTTQQKLHHE